MTIPATSAADFRIESGDMTITSCAKPSGSSHRVARWPANSGCSVPPIELMVSPDRHASWRSTRTSSCGMVPSSLEFGSATHGIEHPSCFDLEPRDFRPLHLDLNRLTAPAENALLALNRRPNAGQLAQLRAEISLNVE